MRVSTWAHKCSHFQILSQIIARHRKGLRFAPISIYTSWVCMSKQERLSEHLTLPLSNHFRLLFLPCHTWFSFLPSSCICLFSNHLRISVSRMKLEFVDLISTLTYPPCCAGCCFQLMKHIGNPSRHIHTYTHSDMFICTHLADLLTLKQFPQQREVADNNVFCYGWQWWTLHCCASTSVFQHFLVSHQCFTCKKALCCKL